MPDPTAAARQRCYRERQAGRLGPALVCSCGRRASGSHGALCSRCWLRTDAGRKWQRLRVAEYRRRKRDGL